MVRKTVKIRIADLNVQIDTQSNYIKSKCSDYACDFEVEDITVRVEKSEIEREKSLVPNYPDDYYEFVCAYRKICLEMPFFDRMIMHGAVIKAGERGYAFMAKSGVGKTTHILNWKKSFPDMVEIINGDKPILAFDGKKVIAYGTPWCGKEGFNINSKVGLDAICLLKRGNENRIQKIDKTMAINFVFGQILLPKTEEAALKTLELASRLLENVPVYELYCTQDKESAQVAKKMLDMA